MAWHGTFCVGLDCSHALSVSGQTARMRMLAHFQGSVSRCDGPFFLSVFVDKMSDDERDTRRSSKGDDDSPKATAGSSDDDERERGRDDERRMKDE